MATFQLFTKISIESELLFAGLQIAMEEKAPLSAFIWWLIPLFGFFGAIAYVIWISKFQSKYENRTNRSVDKFKKFRDSFDDEKK
ncbi:MAG: hypothetical protein O3A12_02315 [Actinobacteria bacterium]|jgi:hypothetical protein|nr:hypothetical protein [Actinomycetota bacterium]MDA2984389.1 hypothetical protein [Actinomycetota bacterium]